MHDIFCFTDIHGHYKLYRAIMDYCNKQDPEAMIIFCGDAIDRGKYGYQIMKELLNNPYVIYLMGNHEDMFCMAAHEIKTLFSFEKLEIENIHKILKACAGFENKYPAIRASLYNGGLPTLTDWIMDGMPMDIVERVEHLPYTCNTEVCDFCHSACVYKSFENVINADYKQLEPDLYCVESLLWGRSGLNFGWKKNRTVIFGHTPVPYLKDYVKIDWNENEKVRPIKYFGEKSTMALYPEYTGAKIDMDTGAVFTGRAFVLNVLTMKAQGFEIENNKVKKIEVIQF